jgi:hypothetical protein
MNVYVIPTGMNFFRRSAWRRARETSRMIHTGLGIYLRMVDVETRQHKRTMMRRFGTVLDSIIATRKRLGLPTGAPSKGESA